MASHCLIDGLIVKGPGYPMLVGIPGAGPQGISGTVKSQEWSRKQHLVRKSFHNVPRNIQGAEVATKTSKTWSLASRSTHATWENKGQNKQRDGLQDNVWHGKRMAWFLDSRSGLLPAPAEVIREDLQREGHLKDGSLFSDTVEG